MRKQPTAAPCEVPIVLQAFQAAVTLHAQGRWHEAAARYRAVLEADPRHFDAAYRLGLIELALGRFEAATVLFRRAAKIDRRSAEAELHLAVALSALERHDQAIRHYRKAIAVRPDFAEAHNNLGYTLQALGRIEEAIEQYQTALRHNSCYPEASNNLGAALAAVGRREEAVTQFRRAIELRPAYADAHRGLADALGALEKYEEAADHYRKALHARPQDPQARTALANVLHRLDRIEEAIAQYEAVLDAMPDHAEARISLGNTLHRLGQPEEAIQHFERVLAVHPGEPAAHGGAGNVLLALGRTKAANEAFERAIALAPGAAVYYWNLASCRRFTEHDPHLAAMQALAEKIESLAAEDRVSLHFALAKALSDVGRPRESFQHLLQGNALKRSGCDYDEAAALNRLKRVSAAFTAELMDRRRGAGDPSPKPIFIIGMPRSGTSLIEQILASHPTVFGAGELRDMGTLMRAAVPDPDGFPEQLVAASNEVIGRIGAQYVAALTRRAPGAERITDKMPGNFIFAGLIYMALPNARIIHACRDPRDTAFSCFSLLFSDELEFTYDLAELGRYHRAYQELMAHWRAALPPGVMLDVQYEALVRHLETEARRILAHCGLEWDDACLDFHKTQRAVRTASALQVRRPVYQSSIGRWRQHEDMLQPLLRELERAPLA